MFVFLVYVIVFIVVVKGWVIYRIDNKKLINILDNMVYFSVILFYFFIIYLFVLYKEEIIEEII